MPAYPRLFVEGKNDVYVICDLLKKHGLELRPGGNPRFPKRPEVNPLDEREESTGVESLLERIPRRVKASGELPVGFVLDADPGVGVLRRWQAVRDRLREVGVTLPDAPISEGYFGYSQDGNYRVGVWLMPDNVRPGAIETFLADLVLNDALFAQARSAVRDAEAIERRYPVERRSKAEVHTWLAWQEMPGAPYGTAIKSGYFDHEAELARAFVAWFRRLYDLPEAG